MSETFDSDAKKDASWDAEYYLMSPDKSEHKTRFHEGWDQLSKRGLVFYQRVVNGFLLSLTPKGRALVERLEGAK